MSVVTSRVRNLGEERCIRIAAHLVAEQEEPQRGIGERGTPSLGGRERDIRPRAGEDANERVEQRFPRLGDLVLLYRAEHDDTTLAERVRREPRILAKELRLGGAARREYEGQDQSPHASLEWAQERLAPDERGEA